MFSSRKRRQSGPSGGTACPARTTDVTLEVPIPEVPDEGHDSDQTTYYNMAVVGEAPYEEIAKNEYDKMLFSQLDTDTDYTTLS